MPSALPIAPGGLVACGRRRVIHRDDTRTPSRCCRAAMCGMALAGACLLVSGTPGRAVAQQQPATDRTGGPEVVVRVMDATSTGPVEGAVLRVDATGVAVRTGPRGTARLGAGAVGHTLAVRAVGYAPREVGIGAGAGDTLLVRLTPVPLSLDQMVITAARRPQRLAEAVVTTEVVNRADIERSGASDLASVLTEQTGVQLQGGHPSGAGVMLQGIGAERVLILMDGQPMVGRLSGNFDLSRIPTNIVDRVEVVKGPQSTLYGSEAMGGVVNIVTRSAGSEGWTANASLLGGSEGRTDGTIGATAVRGALSGVVDLGMRSVHRTPGVASPAGALADRMDVSAKARWAPDSSRMAELSVLRLDERQRWASGPRFDFADNVQTGARLTASQSIGEHRLTPTLHLSRFSHLARTSRTGVPIAGTGNSQVQQLLEAEMLYTGRLGGVAVDAGVEGRRESVSSTDGRIAADDSGTAGSRVLHAVEPFAQVELGGGRWSVVPGARLTWNEQWGSAFTPRIAARWRPLEPLTLRLAVGRGFRAPDFKELYLQFTNDAAGYAVYGNRDLRPEHSDNVTAGAEWSSGRFYARGQLFWNRLRDFIETRPLPTSGALILYTYDNVEQGLTRGTDLEVGAVLGGVRAEAAYGWLDAYDRATNLPLLGRPTHSARASLSRAVPLLGQASLTGVYTGATPMERDEETGQVTGERDAFLRLDARIARQLPYRLELSVGVDNLFDSRPAHWEGVVARQVYSAISWTVAR